MLVGDDLHFDVAGIGDETFDEHHRVTERPLRFALGAFESEFEFVLGEDFADSSATAAGAGLDDQRIPDGLGMTAGIGAGVHRTTGPRCDRDTDLLRQKLRLDLVPQQTHRISARPDEGDVQPGHQIGERRILRHETPAHPHRVRTGLDQRTLELTMIKIRRTHLRLTQHHRLIRSTHEHRPPLGIGMQRHRPDTVVVLGVEFLHSPDQANRRLTPVDYCNPLEQRVSLRLVCVGLAGTGASRPSGFLSDIRPAGGRIRTMIFAAWRDQCSISGLSSVPPPRCAEWACPSAAYSSRSQWDCYANGFFCMCDSYRPIQ